jgi:hypothetical protein
MQGSAAANAGSKKLPANARRVGIGCRRSDHDIREGYGFVVLIEDYTDGLANSNAFQQSHVRPDGRSVCAGVHLKDAVIGGERRLGQPDFILGMLGIEVSGKQALEIDEIVPCVEINDRVDAGIAGQEYELVCTVATAQLVRAVAADQDVVSISAEERIIAAET